MRYCNVIGYVIETETADSVWKQQIVERTYMGDVIRNNTRRDSGDTINDTINISNQISIVADPFALSNFQNIKYVTWLNQKWRVKSVEVRQPRLILEIGGAYNGEDAT